MNELFQINIGAGEELNSTTFCFQFE